MQSKYAAAKLIGVMAERVKDKINGLIFDRARQQCQDYEADVRKVMATEVILKIYKSIGNEICKNILLEKIFELIYDPEMHIKVSSIEQLVNILDYVDNEQKRIKIANQFSEILQLVSEEVVKIMSLKMGTIRSLLVFVKNFNLIFFKILNTKKILDPIFTVQNPWRDIL